jgi:hypothetical protein
MHLPPQDQEAERHHSGTKNLFQRPRAGSGALADQGEDPKL